MSIRVCSSVTRADENESRPGHWKTFNKAINNREENKAG